MSTYLEFEQPLAEIEEQIENQLAIGEKSQIDVSAAVKELQTKLEKEKINNLLYLSSYRLIK